MKASIILASKQLIQRMATKLACHHVMKPFTVDIGK